MIEVIARSCGDPIGVAVEQCSTPKRLTDHRFANDVIGREQSKVPIYVWRPTMRSWRLSAGEKEVLP